MQVSDQVGSLVSFRGEQRTRVIDDVFREAEAIGDSDAAGAARHTNHQAIGRAEINVVEFDGRIDDARCGGGVGLQAIVMCGGEDKAMLFPEFVEERDSKCRTFLGSRASSHLVGEDERIGSGLIEHGFEIEHVSGKGGKIRGNGLFVADINEYVIEERQYSALRGNRNARLGRQRRHASGLQRDSFAPGVRAADDEKTLVSAKIQGNGNDKAIFTAQFVFEHGMASGFELKLGIGDKFRDAGVEVAGKTSAGKNAVELGNDCRGGSQGTEQGLQASGKIFQDAENLGGFVFGKLDKLIVGLNGFEGFDENSLPGGSLRRG